MAAPLNSTVGPFMGTPSITLAKEGRARPVATENVPPWAIKYSMASRFSRDMAGTGPPLRRAPSVYTMVLSKSLAMSTPSNFPTAQPSDAGELPPPLLRRPPRCRGRRRD